MVSDPDPKNANHFAEYESFPSDLEPFSNLAEIELTLNFGSEFEKWDLDSNQNEIRNIDR